MSGWLGFGGPWGVRPSGVGVGGAVVLRGRPGLAGSLPRGEFELGAPGPGAVRECLHLVSESLTPPEAKLG